MSARLQASELTSCDRNRGADASLAQGASQILTQVGERPASGGLSSDQHEIDPRQPRLGQLQPRGLLQPPACPVTYHGIADPLGDREADPRRTIVVAGQGLQDNSMGRDFPPLRRHPQKFRAAFEAARRLKGQGRACHGMEGQGHARTTAERPASFRRRAAFGPWHAGSPAPGDRRRWPSGHETRGGACGQASTVGRCASRPLSRLIESAPIAEACAPPDTARGYKSRTAAYTDAPSNRQRAPVIAPPSSPPRRRAGGCSDHKTGG